MRNLFRVIYIQLGEFKTTTMNKSACLFLLLLVSFSASAGSIFTDDFESGDLSRNVNGTHWNDKKNVTITSEKPRTGNKSARFFFPGVADGIDSFSELRFKLGGNYPELWIRYDLFVPSNYYHRPQTSSTNNKFLYLWSGDYSANFTGPGLSIQNWDTDWDTSTDGESKAVPKAKGVPQSGGGFTFSKHYHSDGGRIFEVEDRGKWLTIVIHAKYASPANNDGVFQLWKIRDGKTIQVFNKTDGDWYVEGQPGFDQGYLLGWANSGYAKDTIFYMDNVEFSTVPLLDGVTAAPKAPAFFQAGSN